MTADLSPRRRVRLYPIPFYLAVIGVWADAVSTHVALQRPGAYEANPLVAPFIGTLGIWPVAVVLTAALFVVALRTYRDETTVWVFELIQLLFIATFITRMVAVFINLGVADGRYAI